jgi:glycosyltransferase involved in cell wall biosynthesis
MKPTSFSARRVAMVSEHASPLAALGGPDAGGQNVYVAQLAARLARRGHEVTVYTRRESRDVPAKVTTADGYHVAHVAAGPPDRVPKDELLPHMAEFGERLGDAWTAAPPDVAHAHFWMSGVAALDGARAAGVPVVQTYHALGTVKRRHQSAADTSPPQRLALERAVGKDCARIIATCHDEVDELAAMGIDPRRVDIVPCGVDTDMFRPAARPKRTHDGPWRLLAVGRLVRRKGFDRAVEALAELPGAELVVAGGPEPALLDTDPEACRLRELAVRYGVADRVRLLGAVGRDAMPRLIGSADVVLSLPRYEPFGIVPLEAMACGTPVVATAVGGQLDTVVDGVTGLRVEPDADPHTLAATVRHLLDDAALRARMGAAGRRRALAHYTWDRVARDVAGVYTSVVSVPSFSGAVR